MNSKNFVQTIWKASTNFANTALIRLLVWLTQKIKGSKHSWVVVKQTKQHKIVEMLFSTMVFSITMKFKRSALGMNKLFQKNFSYRRGSSLSAKEDFSPVWKHKNMIETFTSTRQRKLVLNLLSGLKWSIRQFKTVGGVWISFLRLYFGQVIQEW